MVSKYISSFYKVAEDFLEHIYTVRIFENLHELYSFS